MVWNRINLNVLFIFWNKVNFVCSERGLWYYLEYSLCITLLITISYLVHNFYKKIYQRIMWPNGSVMTLIWGHWPRSFILALIQKRPSLGQKPFIGISGCSFYQDRFVMCLWTFSIFSCTAREEASRERTATTVPCDSGHIYTENLHPQRSQQSLGITSYICRQSMHPGLVLFLMCIVHAICCFIQNRHLSLE